MQLTILSFIEFIYLSFVVILHSNPRKVHVAPFFTLEQLKEAKSDNHFISPFCF
jgi:hypothetical protein